MAFFSVDGGTSDDTLYLQDAFSSVSPGDTVQLSPGVTYTLRQPLVALDVPFTLDAEGALLDYAGVDNVTALTLGYSPGSKIADAFGPRFVVRGLTLRCSLPRNGNSVVGLVWQNVYCGQISGLGLACFGTGMQLIGDGCGCTYGRYGFRQMIDNTLQLSVVARNSGFVSESDIVGPGHFSFNGLYKGQPCCHVRAQKDASPNAEVSSLRFWGASFEGQDSHCTLADLQSGQYFHWHDCRAESAGAMPLVLAAGTYRNVWLGGTTTDVSWVDKNVVDMGNRYLPNFIK